MRDQRAAQRDAPRGPLDRGANGLPLDHAERRTGRRRYSRFFTLNAISVAVHMNSVLILYAIKNGLVDSALAALASFSFLTMPFLLLGKPIVARHGLARTWSFMWMLRYASIALVLVAPLFESVATRTVVILTGVFGFSTFRSMGMINNQPLLGEITTQEERGRYLSGNQMRFNIGYGTSLVAVIVLLHFFESVVTFQALIALGVVVGMLTARILAQIPESGEGRASASVPFRRSVRTILSRQRPRRLIWAWSAGFVAFALVDPFALVAIKNGYGVTDSQATLYVIVGVIGSVMSAFVNQEISDQVGPRPLFAVYVATFGVVALFWAFAPESFYPVIVALVFGVMGFAKTGIIVAVQHYGLSIAREGELFPMSMLAEAISGFAAGIGGTFLAGGLLYVLRLYTDDLSVYRWYFRAVVPIVVVAFLIVLRLQRLKEWKIGHVLWLLASPRVLRAVYLLNRVLPDHEDFPASPAEATRRVKGGDD